MTLPTKQHGHQFPIPRANPVLLVSFLSLGAFKQAFLGSSFLPQQDSHNWASLSLPTWLAPLPLVIFSLSQPSEHSLLSFLAENAGKFLQGSLCCDPVS